MEELMWRFPLSSGGDIKGISGGDEETFKEFPYKSFARELLQNSIDVKYSDETPVRVEFKEFEITKENIPGIDDYIKALYSCRDFWSSKDDYVDLYQSMIDYIEKNDVIPCLRISDYNTTGLVGINASHIKDNNFLALVKGIGFSSKKKGVTGGSKGVGKNASFLLSKLKMVFYSTVTDNSRGSIGVTKLASGYSNDDPKNRKITQGTGYYSIGSDCIASDEILNLDPSFQRVQQKGTDVYVIGIQKNDKWDEEIIKEILSSFMFAIKHNKLEVSFNDNEINFETLKDVIDFDYIRSEKNILAQYDILHSDDTSVFDIETDLGVCSLLLKVYSKKDEKKATNKCFMIRHPGMLIQSFTYPNYNISALCNISDNQLGKTLLSIENPQHTSWQINRLENPAERREAKRAIDSIKEQISENILSVLKSGQALPIDPLGAGDFLPDIDHGDSHSDNGDKQKAKDDDITTTKFKHNIYHEKNPTEYSPDGTAYEPVVGSSEEDGDDVSVPSGENEGTGGSHPGDDPGSINDGDSILFKNSKLKGVRYKIISINKMKGEYRIIFSSPITADNCYLKIQMLDDSNAASNVQILSMLNDSISVTSTDNIEYGPFALNENEKIKLDVTTDIKEFFGSEVKVVCK